MSAYDAGTTPEATVVHVPAPCGERWTVYVEAPVAVFHDRSISEADAAVPPSPLTCAGRLRADATFDAAPSPPGPVGMTR